MEPSTSLQPQTEDDFKCKLGCDKVFASRSNKTRHEQQQHEPTPCPWNGCSFTFARPESSTAKQHKEGHIRADEEMTRRRVSSYAGGDGYADVQASVPDTIGENNDWSTSPEYRSRRNDNGNSGGSPWGLMRAPSTLRLPPITYQEAKAIEPPYGDQRSSREQLPLGSSAGLASTDQWVHTLVPDTAFIPSTSWIYDPATVFAAQWPHQSSPSIMSMVPSQPPISYLESRPTESFEIFPGQNEHQTAAAPKINFPTPFDGLGSNIPYTSCGLEFCGRCTVCIEFQLAGPQG